MINNPKFPQINPSLSLSQMEKNPQILSTNNINGRNSSASNSPEFEFWMIRNPSSQQQTTLHSADELFAGGILLPLQRLTTATEAVSSDPGSDPNPDPSNGADIRTTKDIGSVTSTTTTTSSKRWKDIFKKNTIENKEKEKEKKKKKDRTGGGSTGAGSTTAELNINLWPFSRSRSAGTGGRAPSRTAAAGNRKVSSAPCSRSNSTGESKYRKWPNSPNRVGGVHLNRSSPVWQVKRFGQSQSKSLHDHLVKTTAEKSSRPPAKISGAGAGNNVPTCIGYRQKMSCRSDVAGGNDDGTPASVAGGEGGASGLFNLRSLFTKKVF